MNILDILEAPGMGGINTVFSKISTESEFRQDINWNFCVLSNEPFGWVFEKAKSINVQLDWIPCSSPPTFSVMSHILKMVKNKKIEIIHTRGYRGNIIIRSMLDLGLLNLPVVVTKHGMPAMFTKRLQLYALLDRRPTRLANRVIAVDSYTYKELLYKWKIKQEKLRLVNNPIPRIIEISNQDIQNTKKKYSIDPEKFIGLYIGRIEGEKGVFELLDAHSKIFAEKRNICTIFIGDGSANNELTIRINSNNDKEHILFLGQQLDIVPYLSICDVVILPSYREGLPNVLLEAMAAAKPIIATSVGGIPDLVENNVNGILIPPRDVNSLVSAIKFLMDNKNISTMMGENGRDKATREYLPSMIVDKLISIFKEALSA